MYIRSPEAIDELPQSFNRVPINTLILNINDSKYDMLYGKLITNVFTFSPYMGDRYYPNSKYKIKNKLFIYLRTRMILRMYYFKRLYNIACTQTTSVFKKFS